MIQTSVVIAAYNSAPFIRLTVDDVLHQTNPNFELIIVDDGSTDHTAEVIRSYSDPRIRLVQQKGSGSPASPRNHGLSLAKGEFVTFLDHDDRWKPNRLERVLQCFHDHSEVSIVCHDQSVVSGGVVTGKNVYGPAESDMYRAMLRGGNRLATSATTVRTEIARAAGGFDERREFFTVEDMDLWLKIAKAGNKFYFLHENLGDYIIHTNNMTSNRERHHAAKKALALHHLSISARELVDDKNVILAHCEYALARDYHSLRQYRKAVKKYIEAFQMGYRDPKLLAGIGFALIGVKV